ncbi:LysR family transcriptional regulator [uncultured Celeribacter sp.]|uniref:LysR family transcriptional regulator n=1 Tax=uncultured Celeribacter sp. TaxID=1303376 RepID=UPI002AA645CF|nr:LysR family transcriptional regulator [uncultured Celeribacter sp.]
MLNFKQIEALFWLRELQSYGKVAKKLHLTQPAVSARISALEEQIGQKLVVRAGIGVRLTRLGYELAGYSEHILLARSSFMKRIERQPQNLLRIAIVGPCAWTWAPTFRQILSQEADLPKIEFTVGSNAQIERELQVGAFDIAFLSISPGQSKPTSEFAISYDVGWVAVPELVEKISHPATVKEISTHELILYPPTSPLHSPVQDMLMRYETEAGIQHHTHSLSNIVQMLKFGFGVSAIPLSVVSSEIEEGALEVIQTEDAFPPLIVQNVRGTLNDRGLLNVILEAARQSVSDCVNEGEKFMRLV